MAKGILFCRWILYCHVGLLKVGAIIDTLESPQWKHQYFNMLRSLSSPKHDKYPTVAPKKTLEATLRNLKNHPFLNSSNVETQLVSASSFAFHCPRYRSRTTKIEVSQVSTPGPLNGPKRSPTSDGWSSPSNSRGHHLGVSSLFFFIPILLTRYTQTHTIPHMSTKGKERCPPRSRQHPSSVPSTSGAGDPYWWWWWWWWWWWCCCCCRCCPCSCCFFYYFSCCSCWYCWCWQEAKGPMM